MMVVWKLLELQAFSSTSWNKKIHINGSPDEGVAGYFIALIDSRHRL